MSKTTDKANDTSDSKEILATVPSEWPGAFGVYKYSKEAVFFNLNTYLNIVVIGIIASTVTSMIHGPEVIKFVFSLASMAISFIASAAVGLLFLASTRREKQDLKQCLSKITPSMIVNLIVMDIILVVIAFASLLALVIPFFFVMPRLSLSLQYLLDKNMSPTDAISASWNVTRGNIGKIYGIYGANLVYLLLMLTIIGIPFAVYFLVSYSAADFILYRFLDKADPQENPQDNTAPIAV